MGISAIAVTGQVPAEVPFYVKGRGPATVVGDAATYVIDALDSGKVHIVPDLTADCTITLPPPADDLEFVFEYGGGAEDAHDWIFDAGSDSNFFIGGVTCLDPGDGDVLPVYSDGDSNSKMSVLTPGCGTKVEIRGFGANWRVSGIAVTNTDAGVVFADQ
jgi:hypothetical protein